MRLLLDTHALLWWLFDDPKLAGTPRELIADRENEILVSSASAWEICTKHRLGKLPAANQLVLDVAAWVRRAGFAELPVAIRHAQRMRAQAGERGPDAPAAREPAGASASRGGESAGSADFLITMTVRSSKEMIVRKRECKYVLSAFRTEGDNVAEALNGLTQPNLVETDEVPNYVPVVRGMGRNLETSISNLDAFDRKLAAAVGWESTLRKEHREKSEELTARAGDHWWALPLPRVRRVIHALALHPLPGATDEIAGLAFCAN